MWIKQSSTSKYNIFVVDLQEEFLCRISLFFFLESVFSFLYGLESNVNITNQYYHHSTWDFPDGWIIPNCFVAFETAIVVSNFTVYNQYYCS